MSKLRVKLPVVTDDGFILGRKWNDPQQTIMINKDGVKSILVDCGNSPPANRIQFYDGRPDLDIIAEMAD